MAKKSVSYIIIPLLPSGNLDGKGCQPGGVLSTVFHWGIRTFFATKPVIPREVRGDFKIES
jgi:hypothetical protein